MTDQKQNTGNNQNGDASAGNAAKHARFKDFDIPKYVQKNYDDLIVMVLDTKSMDDKERQYWFHILPIMSDKQVTKLRTILMNEKRKLAEIDQKYKSGIDGLENKQISHWEQGKLKERFAEIKGQEITAEQQEKAKEEELLKQLEGI